MSTKKYMQRFKASTLKLEGFAAERERLTSIVYGVTADPSVGGAGGGLKDKVGDGVARLVDLDRSIDEESEIYESARADVHAVVDEVMDRNIVWGQCLHYRYIMFDEPQQCAARMGYPERSERRIHRLALAEAAKVIQQKTTANDRSERDII